MDSSHSPIRTEIVDGVGIISLCRPQRHNALDDASRAALAESFRWAARETSVRSVLLRGEGKSFCSGRDRKNFLDPSSHGSHRGLIAAAQEVRREQIRLRKPAVCAMQGHVIGAGAELALGCDMRIVADDLQFRFPEVGFGIVADTGSSLLLPRLVGPARAKWMLISGKPLSAEDAVRWGLAEWAVPRSELDSRALEIAATLARQPAAATQRQKELIDASLSTALDDALGREMLVQLDLFEGEEYVAVSRSAR